MGASVATFISYFVVFVIRAVTMKSFIPFKLYPVKLVLNTVMIVAMSVIMSLWGARWQGLAASIAILCVSIVYNGKDIILGCRDALVAIKSKKE